MCNICSVNYSVYFKAKLEEMVSPREDFDPDSSDSTRVATTTSARSHSDYSLYTLQDKKNRTLVVLMETKMTMSDMNKAVAPHNHILILLWFVWQCVGGAASASASCVVTPSVSSVASTDPKKGEKLRQ